MTTQILSQKKLKELLHYNPETGVFTWKSANKKYLKSQHAAAVWKGQKEGKSAGSIRKRSGKRYIDIRICGKCYLAHRLAWLYSTGKFPPEEIGISELTLYS